MNGFIRTFFFLSALAPAIFMIAIKQLLAIGGTAEVIAWLVASSLAVVLPWLIVKAASRQLERMPFAAKKVESQDWLLVVIVVGYFLPLTLNISDFQVCVLVLAFAAVLLSVLDVIPCHPVLHLFFRYRFYKVEGANGMIYVLVTHRRILSAADIRAVKLLSPQLLMEA